MKILHVDLHENGIDRVDFRYFWDNPNEIKSYTRSLSRIQQRTKKADTDYYTRIPVDFRETGKSLYDWLDGSDRILDGELNKHRREGIILAISTSQGLARLPWELLHDGRNFLIAGMPPIIPVRWVKTEGEKQLHFMNNPVNRALNVLFMASSARDVLPELDFEAEEAKILEATRGKPLSLVVEESGCLAELCEWVKAKERDYFDVIHLTGHAELKNGKPYFITETEYGDRQDTSAEDIAEGLAFNLPKLLFLSGCKTGYADDDEVLSLAEELLKLGATAVLGWGKPVRDWEASDAAAVFYQELATGSAVTEALSKTYRALLQNQARDWHGLRLYVTGNVPGELVTRGQRRPLPVVSTVEEFIDPDTRHLRVAPREMFVGRRRELQECLRVLKTAITRQTGVFIQGMGGNGKSTIAARLCDRLPDHDKIVWWRQVDETALVDRLGDQLRNREQRSALRDASEDLKFRLRDLFETLEKPFLFVFDDFEWNLEYRKNRYLLKTEVAEVMNALIWAIEQTNYYHGIIITCRYDFEWKYLGSFYGLRGLRSLTKADLQKKLRRLENFNNPNLDESYFQRALQLADGNPRLLEWLNDDVLSREDIDSQLSHYENSPDGWRDRVIWRLENQPKLEIDETLEKVIGHCLIYEIPVPWTALEAVCESIPNYREKLQQAKQRGLIEESIDNREEKLYRASHLPCIDLPQEEQELFALSRIAAETLDRIWGNRKNQDEEKWCEIFRLSFLDTENPRRFREGFSKMLSFYYNPQSDNAFEKELRRTKNCLSKNRVFENLERYLLEKNWRKADEETAWICYQIMVIDDYKDFHKLFREVSKEFIEKIDILWSESSQGEFGLKIQAKLYQKIGGTEKYDNKIWNDFVDLVGYGTFNTTIKTGNLPELMYHFYSVRWGDSPYRLGGDFAINGFRALWVSIFSRVKT
ncbi:CHAT domain-containing protein [Pannus brasiliensis CCIBt3594]|uniref:CHAT domain-containing protein n=1 Tax=Pannus brasiliensis CCIBt3594 TaxID=1427578 RepID=A0AAW9QXX4_9CHRO